MTSLGQPPESVAAREDVSVVVCTYTLDRLPQLHAAISSIATQTTKPREIIVVVDHNPALFELLGAQIGSTCRLVENEGRRGLSDARNSGVMAADGSIVAFVDDDARAEPDWLAMLVRHYQDPNVIGVGGAAMPVWAANRPSWFPGEFDWVVGCTYLGMPRKLAQVRNLLGCNMSFRRSAFEIPGFDARIGRVDTRPVGCEETEFCIRVTRAFPGTALLYEPAAVVWHSVTVERAKWRYFIARCYSEGQSKAQMSRIVGSDAGLASERRHALVTLPSGVLRAVAEAVRRRRSAPVVRAAAIIVGLMTTAVGYVSGSMLGDRELTPAEDPAQP